MFKHYQLDGKPKLKVPSMPRESDFDLKVDFESKMKDYKAKMEKIETDDHYSPVRPEEYIEQRLKKKKQFYEERLPWYAAMRLFLKLLTLSCTVAASIIARFGLSSYVTLITAFATGITSWQEFSDVERKMERYTRAIAAIENLLSQWDATSEVERASSTATANLVLTGESIIANERLAWTSTATARDEGAKDTEKPPEVAEPGRGGAGGRNAQIKPV